MKEYDESNESSENRQAENHGVVEGPSGQSDWLYSLFLFHCARTASREIACSETTVHHSTAQHPERGSSPANRASYASFRGYRDTGAPPPIIVHSISNGYTAYRGTLPVSIHG